MDNEPLYGSGSFLMILSKSAILAAVDAGDINIDPFDPQALNPNSYNFRLGPQLLEWSAAQHEFVPVAFPGTGFLLHADRLYLGSTLEYIGSRRYAMLLLGRSSIGRLGLFVNISADLGHTGSLGQWTLELRVVQPLRIYPGQNVGQISFWVTSGVPHSYAGRYKFDVGPA